MKQKTLYEEWKYEESIAQIHGWDFSHLCGRYEEEQDLPWDYKQIIHQYLKDEDALLDMDTGGGEFLLSLQHPYDKTYCTEAYAPNLMLCKQRLSPLGIHVKGGDALDLPFADSFFDVVINRHGDFDEQELYRVLKQGGIFISEQVGAENDRDIVKDLQLDMDMPFPDQYLDVRCKRMQEAGFQVLYKDEAYRPICFYDVGALVWFAHIIEWEFKGFDVDDCYPQLLQIQKIIEEQGFYEGHIHRFMMVMRKCG